MELLPTVPEVLLTQAQVAPKVGVTPEEGDKRVLVSRKPPAPSLPAGYRGGCFGAAAASQHGRLARLGL